MRPIVLLLLFLAACSGTNDASGTPDLPFPRLVGEPCTRDPDCTPNLHCDTKQHLCVCCTSSGSCYSTYSDFKSISGGDPLRCH